MKVTKDEAIYRATTENSGLKEQIWHSPIDYVMLALGYFLHGESHMDCHSTVLRHLMTRDTFWERHRKAISSLSKRHKVYLRIEPR